jgi:predicted SPOUT superfamily RNA methylase MTH1
LETQEQSSQPSKRRNRLSVAVPASFVSDIPHLRERTFRIGLVSRALSIYCVDEVIIYPDYPQKDQSRDTFLIKTILAYMETPQYLRKRLFKIMPELQYAGTLPPLRTPHHPLADKIRDLRVGEFREGVVISNSNEGSLVDIGVEQPALVSEAKLKANNRVTVRIIQLDKQPKAASANREEIKTYWGYQVTVSPQPIGQMVKNRQFDIIVATSRKGKPINAFIDELKKNWSQTRTTLVAFGAPSQGLFEILARENLQLKDLAHFIVNTIPNQGTETVRTEEALCGSLALLSTFE